MDEIKEQFSELIDMLGQRRVTALFVLVISNLLIGAILYGYVLPHDNDMVRKSRMFQSQINSLNNDTEQIQAGLDVIGTQQARFKDIEKHGFLGRQGRYDAGQALERIQEISQVKIAKVKIGAGKIIEDDAAMKAGYRVLQSEIKISIDSLDDRGIMAYILMLENQIAGHVSIKKIAISRLRAFNEAVSTLIVQGKEPVLVDANIVAEWTTMIPESMVLELETRGAR